ncbi:MAG: hypothetical protein HZB50_10320 [Chloroflexi bacterium]|nr:hypothetical protein [Chloroflexota bacterium]
MCPLSDTPANIGKIVENLQSLEFALRLVLDELQGIHNKGKGAQMDFMKLTVGEWVPETFFTNYDSLNQLIQKVNSEFLSHGLIERVDESLVELRDALAHGRVLALNPDGPYRMLKFSKPKDDKVQVTISIDITSDWLTKQINRTAKELQKVVRLGQALGLKCFPSQ